MGKTYKDQRVWDRKNSDGQPNKPNKEGKRKHRKFREQKYIDEYHDEVDTLLEEYGELVEDHIDDDWF